MNTTEFSLKVIRAIPGNLKRKDPDNMWGKSGLLDFPCQRCGKQISWGRVQFNGHIRAACETPSCFGLLS